MDNQPSAKQDGEHPDAALPPPDVAKPLNPKAASPATEQQLQEVEREMTGFERATLRWARVAVIMSGLAAIFVCAQWYEMHQGGVDTHALAVAAGNQADAATDMAIAAGDQVDAGNNFADSAEGINRGVAGAVDQLQEAAKNAKASIRATQDAMRLDQRAWVGAGDYTYSITESGPIESSASIGNTGKTPAMNILCKTTGTAKVKGYILLDSDIIYPPDLPILKQGTLFPNQRFPLKACCGTALDPGTKKIWFDNVQSGDWIQYFYGEVRYKDAFEREHWTHFCTQFVPSTKSGTPCPVYNETDDTQHQKPKQAN